jgi:hypothetical protein
LIEQQGDLNMQKTKEEVEAMPPEQRAIYDEEQRKIVSGHDYKKDANGNPVEQGIGAPGHETVNHYAALAKAEGQAAVDAARLRSKKIRAGR